MEVTKYEIGDRVSWKDEGIRTMEGEIIAIHDGQAGIYFLTWDHTFTHTWRPLDKLNPVSGGGSDINGPLLEALNLGVNALSGLHLECKLNGIDCLQCTAIDRLKAQRSKLMKGGRSQ